MFAHIALRSALVVLAAAATPLAAQPVTNHSGQIVAIFPDPSDFVVQLSVNGRCGSNFFHVQRANQNFKEMAAAAYTAFAATKTMGFYVTSCSGDRNIVSHGYILR